MYVLHDYAELYSDLDLCLPFISIYQIAAAHATSGCLKSIVPEVRKLSVMPEEEKDL